MTSVRSSNLTTDDIFKKKCVKLITSTNDNSFFQCLAIGLAFLDNKQAFEKMTNTKDRYKRVAAHEFRNIRATEIADDLKMQFHRIACNEIPVFEARYNVQVNIYNGISKSFVYPENERNDVLKERQLYFLCTEGGHYDFVTSAKALINSNYFCTICNSGYSKKNQHKCIIRCRSCNSPDCAFLDDALRTASKIRIHCEDCRFKFRSQECFDLHKKTRRCEPLKICDDCNKPYRRNGHKCSNGCFENKRSGAVALDVETTGFPWRMGWNEYYPPEMTWYYDQSRIISIAIVSDDFSKYSLIRPLGDFKNDPRAFETHGISEEEVKSNGISLGEFFNEDVIHVLQNAKFIVAHNAKFDINVLRSDLIRSGLNDISEMLKHSNTFCTMEEGRKFMGGRKCPRLTELYSELFEHEVFGAHNALEDAKASFRCYKEITRK